MIKKFIAKSNHVTLYQHSINVSVVANIIANRILPSGHGLYETIRIAALLHDIGKVYSKYQDYLKGKSKYKKQPYYHNEIGWAFLHNYLKVDNTANREYIVNAVYWHHGIDNKMGDKSSFDIKEILSNDDIENMQDFVKNTLGANYIHEHSNVTKTPKYYKYSDNDTDNDDKYNKDMTMVRTIIISSDRIVSELELNNPTLDLTVVDTNSITDHLDKLIGKQKSITYNPVFYEKIDLQRFEKQCDIVSQCQDESVTVINAPAGFGKTLTGLLWSQSKDKKLIWVCPRNVVVQSVYNSIIDELKSFKLDRQVSVELFIGGEVIDRNNGDGEFNSDIIVTNIDNFLAPTVKDNIASRLFLILESDVVFDEYHEFLSEDPFFYGFINIMRCRHHYTKSKTLLLSATPINIDYMWNTLGKSTKILPERFKHYDAAHKTPYTINVDTITKDELTNKKGDSSITIVNSIYNSQFFKSESPDSILYHSNFTVKEKDAKLKTLMLQYGKTPDTSLGNPHYISTLIAQASLDVSFKHLYESILSPEFTIQRVGRTNRFGNFIGSTINILKIVDLEKDELDRSEQMVVNMFYREKLMDFWYNELEKYNGKQLILDELYCIYNKHTMQFEKERKELFSNILLDSKKMLTKVYPLRKFGGGKKTNVRVSGGNKLRNTSLGIFYIAEMTNERGDRINKFTDEVFTESIELWSKIEKEFNEDSKTLGKMRNAVALVKQDVLRNDMLYSDWEKKKINSMTIDKFRVASKYSNTPYIRFDVVYHPVYGLIKENRLNKLNN